MENKPGLVLINNNLKEKQYRIDLAKTERDGKRYRNHVLTIYSPNDVRLGFITRRIRLTKHGLFWNDWCASTSISEPIWEGSFALRKEAREFLEAKRLNEL